MLGWLFFLRSIKIQHFKELFYTILLYNFIFFPSIKNPFPVQTMVSLSKNVEKMIKSLGAELPGSFAKYSWCLIFKFLWNGIPQRHQNSSSRRQISQTYTQTLSENKILMSCIPAWATFEDRMIKSALSNNLPLARGYWKLLPLWKFVQTKKGDAWDWLGRGEAKSYSSPFSLSGSFCFFSLNYFSVSETINLTKSQP